MAQEPVLKGKVLNGDTPLEAAHIINLSKASRVISNAEGQFEIPAKKGDSLFISFLGYREVLLVVTPEMLSGPVLAIKMEEAGIPLEAITVESAKPLSGVDLGILDKVPEKHSPNERRLKDAGDFKPIQLLGILGGGLPLESMLNKITGRTKKLKKRVAIEKENELHTYLKLHYAHFVESRLEILTQNTDLFLYYAAINGDWEYIYPNGSAEQYQFHLIQLHQKYLEEQQNFLLKTEDNPKENTQQSPENR